MIVTEADLRELWRDGRNALPAFEAGTRFSPAALDFLKDHQLTPVFADPGPAAHPPSSLQLPASNLPPFLARLDTLHALTGLVAAEARRARLPELAAHLDTLAAYAAALHAAAEHGSAAPSLVWSSALARAASPVRPGPHDHAIAHWLNYLRATAREAALSAPETAQAGVRRLASAVEDLQQLWHSGQLAWKAGG
jgi:hypothetical protein